MDENGSFSDLAQWYNGRSIAIDATSPMIKITAVSIIFICLWFNVLIAFYSINGPCVFGLVYPKASHGFLTFVFYINSA